MSSIVNTDFIIQELNKCIEYAYDKGRVAGYEQGRIDEKRFVAENVARSVDEKRNQIRADVINQVHEMHTVLSEQGFTDWLAKQCFEVNEVE